MSQAIAMSRFKKPLSVGRRYFMLGGMVLFLLAVSSVPIIVAVKTVVIVLFQIFTENEFSSKLTNSRQRLNEF